MVNVARTTWRLYPDQVTGPPAALLERMGKQAVLQVRVAVNAFVDGDVASSAALLDMDDRLDEMHDLLVRRAVTRRPGDADDVAVNRAVQLTLVARHYERAGDHAVTIAGFVPFLVDGRRRVRRWSQ
jgi:phosphate transport system protein